MKIKKMNASFGCLNGRSLELGEGLNILTAPNESGKSTWCAFIRTMLYGLNTAERGRQGTKPDKLKYVPWSGAAMAGSMELEHEGRNITLRRWTGEAGQSMQEFSATYTGTEDPVPDLEADTAGERLTGAGRSVFERSAFVKQAGMALSNSAELEKRIHAIVASGEEELSFTELDKQLRSWQRHRKSGKRGAIPELEAEMAGTGESLRKIRDASEEVLALEEQLEQARRERDEAVRHMQQARARQRKMALEELGRSRRQMQELETEREQALQTLEQREKSLKATPFGGKTPEQAAEQAEDVRWRAGELLKLASRMPPKGLSWAVFGLSVLAFGLAAVLDWAMWALGLGFVLMMLFVVIHIRMEGMRRLAAETMEDRRKMLAAYGVEEPEELQGLLEGYEALWQKRTEAKRALTAAEQRMELARMRQKETDELLVSGLDFSHGDSEAVRAGRAVEAAEARISELKERRAAAEGRARASGDPMVLESTLAEQQQRLEGLQEQYDALDLAIETLAEADGELQSRFSPRLSQKAAEYFRALTGLRYEEVTIAKDLSARVRREEDTVGREAEYLSAGAVDQLYLAVRLAVCELALPGEACPLVLDDALVNFDDERMSRALELIRQLAEKRQVLLFSCHEREQNYFMDDPAVTVIPVV